MGGEGKCGWPKVQLDFPLLVSPKLAWAIPGLARALRLVVTTHGDRSLCAHQIEKQDDASKRAERIACVEDYLLALATYSATCRSWPDAHITLRRASA
jgi:hypothetical protein